MTRAGIALQFNALTDPWLPLLQEDGQTVWASPFDVLRGTLDGVDLDYPRDDFRVYARLLLSALVQALFPAETAAELRTRLDNPLTADEIGARLSPELLRDFDLLGPTPFLQVAAQADEPDGGAAPFVFPPPDLFQPATKIDAVSLPIALVTLFAEQTYSGGAGRGYGAGPGGQPGALTLIDAGTVRRSAWANTITTELASRRYAAEAELPWSNERRGPQARGSIGLVTGLLFQPRGIWLIPAGEGVCSFTGQQGPLVRLSPFLPKSALSPKPSSGEDVWVHPCAPMAVNSQGIAPVRLSAERPAWTGLAQLLAPLSKVKTRTEHPLEGPALVVAQWKELNLRSKTPRLLVLDFDRDKANVKRRFFEAFPLTHDIQTRETLEQLRTLATQTQSIERSLVKALTRAHDDRRAGGLALADARTAFWTATETPFLEWLAAVSIDSGDNDDAAVRRAAASDNMIATARRCAQAAFDAHVELSEFDFRKQELVAKARRQLYRELWGTASRPVATSSEVSQ